MAYHPDYPRVLPPRRPAGHTPAAPRFAVRWPGPVTGLVADYFAIQGEAASLDWPAQAAFFARARDAFAGPDGPEAFETLRCTDDAGLINAIIVAYWKDPVAHARWNRASALTRWFQEDARLEGPFGCWRETLSVPYERHETIISEPYYRVGLGRMAETEIAPITANGYFGAARDRLPISAIDPLESPHGETMPQITPPRGFGQRLAVSVPVNMVALRSGQFWGHAEGEQLADYVETMQPRLMAGMAYLTRNKEKTGTLSLRIMTNLDPEGGELRETSVYAHFLSLAPLERWSESHATHLAIYHHAIAMNRQYGKERQFVSWHELFALPWGRFDYVNCDPRTGLLPFCTAEVLQRSPQLALPG